MIERLRRPTGEHRAHAEEAQTIRYFGRRRGTARHDAAGDVW
jgi:hypothetical protein